MLIGMTLSLLLLGINSSVSVHLTALEPTGPGRWRRSPVPGPHHPDPRAEHGPGRRGVRGLHLRAPGIRPTAPAAGAHDGLRPGRTAQRRRPASARASAQTPDLHHIAGEVRWRNRSGRRLAHGLRTAARDRHATAVGGAPRVDHRRCPGRRVGRLTRRRLRTVRHLVGRPAGGPTRSRCSSVLLHLSRTRVPGSPTRPSVPARSSGPTTRGDEPGHWAHAPTASRQASSGRVRRPAGRRRTPRRRMGPGRRVPHRDRPA